MNLEERRAGPADNKKSRKSVLKTIPFQAAQITGGFWGSYQQLNRSLSLAHGYAMLEKYGNFSNLRVAAGLTKGDFRGYRFADSDVYKWLEAVGWELGRAPESDLQAMADEAVSLIEKAQQPDGYLNSYYQFVLPEKRWMDLAHGHELYCAGHLIQAAIAFQRAVGDDRLLQVALRFVEHIDDMFGTGKRDETCGHPEIETALVELYRVTGDERHLELAQIFIDRRGRNRMSGHAGYGPIYQQDHIPFRQATEVAGHVVRQLYLTTGAADLYMENGDPTLLDALHTLWTDMSQRKLYLTGGVGSRHDGEAFGDAYELPPDTCYCETCAAIASLMWNWRMLLITGHGRYADLFERTLYNGVLCSLGLDGASCFYVNPLQLRDERYAHPAADTNAGEVSMRPEWHNCACCPPNLMRLLSSLSHYIATVSQSAVQIHQYAAAHLAVKLGGEPVVIDMDTAYPWDGQISISVKTSPTSPWSLSLRIPEWCSQYNMLFNSKELSAQPDVNGYLTLNRQWQPGDTLQLNFHIAAAFVAPNPRIDALRNSVAIQRGPLVYCFESHDQPEMVDLYDVAILTSEPLVETAVSIQDANFIAIQAAGQLTKSSWDGSLYRPFNNLPATETIPVQLKAIPYFLWANRGMKSMRVWVPGLVE